MNKSFTYDEIMDKLTEILVEDFEIDKSTITPSANLFDDLELDSIDAVDLAVKLQYFTDRKIPPENFKKIKTVEDVAKTIEELVKWN